MKFTEYAKTYIPKVNEAIKSIYDKKLNNVDNPFLIDYYLELKDYFLSGGKRIRPLLCIATFNGFSENPDDKIVLPSVGVEFLHNASLIHDDIIDKDDFRRGQPAFHFRFRNYHKQYNIKKMIDIDFGNSIGIIGGDSAFIIGLEAYFSNDFDRDLNLNAIKYYEQAFLDIINGVLIETDMVNQKNLTISDYIKMISLKTGALIEKSILIGANYARVDEEFTNHLSTYGINLGIIFQMIDDILGTFGDEKITGKPTDGDIREGKKTCLLIDALNKLDKKKRKKLEQLIEKPSMSNQEVQNVKGLFIEADVIDSCKDLTNSYFLEAKVSLNELKHVINQSEFEFFENLLNFVIERKF
ncbi:MAG: polyprenyl synthetase family protein [Promethearchaeota archaeon]|nr:MAG: polyprenyl synthetase family protein [Candidatus Lokiarchaeota archaeon]